MQLLNIFSSGKRLDKQLAKQLYEIILVGALNVDLYEKGLAVDTFQGRFEQAALHGGLMMRALRERGQHKVSKALSDEMFAGFDHAYRETGVGDSSISRKVRKLGEQFYGLARGLDGALEGEDNIMLGAFVRRNGLANGCEVDLVGYLRSANKGLLQIQELSTAKWPNV